LFWKWLVQPRLSELAASRKLLVGGALALGLATLVALGAKRSNDSA
jgi:hypothetical protein